jgi:AhpD family alkylhydroperoxidase
VKRKLSLASVALFAIAGGALAQTNQQNASNQAPTFMRETLPPDAVQPAGNEMKAITDPNVALDAKTKELIGLGVAAQIPCDYCVYYHTQEAKHFGATDAPIKEALASAARTRKWSTLLNGSDYGMAKQREEVDAMVAHEPKPGSAQQASAAH